MGLKACHCGRDHSSLLSDSSFCSEGPGQWLLENYVYKFLPVHLGQCLSGELSVDKGALSNHEYPLLCFSIRGCLTGLILSFSIHFSENLVLELHSSICVPARLDCCNRLKHFFKVLCRFQCSVHLKAFFSEVVRSVVSSVNLQCQHRFRCECLVLHIFPKGNLMALRILNGLM